MRKLLLVALASMLVSAGYFGTAAVARKHSHKVTATVYYVRAASDAEGIASARVDCPAGTTATGGAASAGTLTYGVMTSLDGDGMEAFTGQVVGLSNPNFTLEVDVACVKGKTSARRAKAGDWQKAKRAYRAKVAALRR